jgi:hypothetical protein
MDVIIVFILCSISLVVGYVEGYGEGKREMFKALNDYKNDEREEIE